VTSKKQNLDPATVGGFGREWSAFDQTGLGEEEFRRFFDAYFHLFPWADLPPDPQGFDLGCGSGRWAMGVAPRVGTLHCIDASHEALSVARSRLGKFRNVRFHHASVDAIPLPDGSQDFGYSLGVLHHVPDTMAALIDCVRKLKFGAPFLLYLYYKLDGRPFWFRAVWRTTDILRRAVARTPFALKRRITDVLAGIVYWPLARLALGMEKGGLNVQNVPLASYRNASFYTMRTDALDRFGTRLEQRFTRAEVEQMMRSAGLGDIVFSDSAPYWVACGKRVA
jgi:SAM-dependent methyltransferase